MMEIRQPRWQLRQACPVCEQGGLVLVACPQCSHIAVICAEEGSGFESARMIEPESAVDPKSVSCAQCGRWPLSAFRDATADQILGAGLRPAEYE